MTNEQLNEQLKAVLNRFGFEYNNAYTRAADEAEHIEMLDTATQKVVFDFIKTLVDAGISLDYTTDDGDKYVFLTKLMFGYSVEVCTNYNNDESDWTRFKTFHEAYQFFLGQKAKLEEGDAE